MHLHVDQCFSHPIVKCEHCRVVEHKVNHLLKFIWTFWKEKRHRPSQLKILKELRLLSICESVSDWGGKEGGREVEREDSEEKQLHFISSQILEVCSPISPFW